MAYILFYTKPGCLGGIKQKEFLLAAGHDVKEHSILEVSWTPETLQPFLAELPLSEWYNPNAPAVKAGRIIPGMLPEKETLDLLCSQPILIKRPLMQIGEHKMAGFDTAALAQVIDIGATIGEDFSRCQAPADSQSCPDK